MKFKDYYEILGLTRQAASDEVKLAYRKLARKYHPDVSKEPNAEEKFKELQEAYEVLRDPDKRAAYDQLGRNYRSGQQFRPPPDWARRQGGGHGFADLNGFSEFFSTLFGNSAGPPPSDAEAGQLDVSIEEAFGGARRRVAVNESGRTRYLDVQIPAGVTDGQQLRVGGQGGRSGLLYRVKLRPHALYSVQGRDVLVDLPLAPWEAALGAKVAVPTLAGTVELTIPAGAQSGQKLRLRGRGLPGTPAGDQFVIVKILAPAAQTAAAKEAYERLKRELDWDPRAGWP